MRAGGVNNMKNYKIAVAGTGARDIIRVCHNRDKGTAENERLRKEKMLHLAVDDDGIAVAGKTMLNRAGGSKVLDCFYFEDPSIRPCDGSRLHVTGGVEVGVDLDIDTLWQR